MRGPARRSARPAAFTLVEVIVALAVMLILAAVAVPQLTGYLDQKRVEEAAAQLAGVRDALYKAGAGDLAFYQTVGSNAGYLEELITPLAAGDLDSCQSLFTNAQRNSWSNGGPFLNYVITSSGMATPIGQADNRLIRTPANGGGSSGTLRITFTNTVSLSDAEALDLHVDGVAGWNAGTVQWTPQLGTDGVVTLHYFVVINGTC